MPTWIDHDGDGFVYAAQTTEGPDVASARPQADPDDAHQAAEGRLVRYVDGRFEVPRDDRAAWRLLRARGVMGGEHAAALDHVRELRRRWPSDLAPEVLLPVPAPPPDAVLPGLDADFPAVPGLHFRAMTAVDLDRAATLAIETGIYPAVCPDGQCSPPEAHAWMALAHRIDRADTWQTVLEFNGEPLQMELILHDGDQATFSLTMHLTRERPHWFWREAEAPAIQAMRRAGITQLRSFTRKDRPDWVQALKDNYGAVQVAELANTIHLSFPLDGIEARFTGWPVRKALGFDQTTARVRVWEATQADLPAVRTLVRSVPAARRAIALRTLEEWYTLDRATLLLGALDGTLRYARLIRPRRGTVGALAWAGPIFDEPEQVLVTAAIRAWARQAGYTTLTSFIPESLLANPLMQAQLARSGMTQTARHPQFKEPFVEVADAV